MTEQRDVRLRGGRLLDPSSNLDGVGDLLIRNGKVEELVRPVMLSGNLFTTLANLDMVGNDLDMNQGGGCGKDGQSPLPVSNGSPHIRIQKCLVGGA